ncbi:hypothetical protein [Exiguobacterium sp. s150]|uniref:hypothetical protein n=1 Tax=Exiguobacterium sp. s150 TaxID=2751221 RepID=UPI001BE907BC|nr:hypothetical protein [Exiguobacterium sp. s150]
MFSLTREQEKPLDLNEREWPLISILVPCYNEEETLKRRLQILRTGKPISGIARL